VDHLANMNNALQWMLLQPGVNPQLGVWLRWRMLFSI
jgi:hypothetical protein